MSAREFLSQRGVDYESRNVDDTPVDRAGALAMAGAAPRLLVKAGPDILRFDPVTRPLTDADALAYLVHEDGFLRVPVLLIGTLLVRGYTDDLYREIFDTLLGA